MELSNIKVGMATFLLSFVFLTGLYPEKVLAEHNKVGGGSEDETKIYTVEVNQEIGELTVLGHGLFLEGVCPDIVLGGFTVGGTICGIAERGLQRILVDIPPDLVDGIHELRIKGLNGIVDFEVAVSGKETQGNKENKEHNQMLHGICSDTWSKIIPDANERFELAMPTEKDPDGEAVLDKETCLVWELAPGDSDGDMNIDDADRRDHTHAIIECWSKKVGGRMGWRLPTAEELLSLVDTDVPGLPVGHPFKDVQSSYWSATSIDTFTPHHGVTFNSSGSVGGMVKSAELYVWCVRGRQGYDAN